jgi:hypothetical protein
MLSVVAQYWLPSVAMVCGIDLGWYWLPSVAAAFSPLGRAAWESSTGSLRSLLLCQGCSRCFARAAHAALPGLLTLWVSLVARGGLWVSLLLPGRRPAA